MKDLEELYNKVFVNEGRVKLCDRDACKALIIKIKELSGRDVGNQDTGFMDLGVLKDEYNKLMLR